MTTKTTTPDLRVRNAGLRRVRVADLTDARLWNMRPISTSCDGANAPPCQTKMLGEAFISETFRVKPPNFDNDLGIQNRLRVSFANECPGSVSGVYLIFTWRHVFQVACGIIGSVAVFVINLTRFRTLANKRLGNETMHKSHERFTANPEINCQIPIWHLLRGENAIYSSAEIARDSANFSILACLIGWKCRYRIPYLHRHVIERTHP